MADSEPPSAGIRSRWPFVAVSLALVLLAVELVLALFFWAFQDRFPFPDPQRYVADPAALAQARGIFDAELGWRRTYDTPFGERPRQVERGRPWIATFGDSFTHGDEVEDAETWSEHLGALLDVDVLNFGGGAYGMDQAVLRFEGQVGRLPVRQAIFAFISNDIRRNLTHYWPFHQPRGLWPLTKPRFRLTEEGLVLAPNPVQRERDLDRLTDPAFIEQMGEGDWFFDRHRVPPRRPPHLRLVAHPRFWRALLDQRRETDLWHLEHPRRLAVEIMLRFVRRARAAGITPTIVHLPVVGEVVRFSNRGVAPPAERLLRTLCTRRGLRCIFPLASLKGDRGSIEALFLKGIKGGHYTPEGHRRVAEALAPALGSFDVPSARN